MLVEEWGSFCALASEAASIFPTQHHRAMILRTLNDVRSEVCSGDAEHDDGDDEPASPVSPVTLAARRARGKARKVSGLREEVDAARPGGEDAEWRVVDAGTAAAPRCPFGFGGGAPPAGHPPVGGAGGARSAALPPGLAATVRTMAERGGQTADTIAAMLQLDAAAVRATLEPPADAGSDALPPGLAEAARTMAERGVDAEQIATMLKVSVAAVRATVGGGADAGKGASDASATKVGKVVGDPVQARLDELLYEETSVCCLITLVLFVDPVKAPDGFLYERSAAEALKTAEGHFVSPMTRESLPMLLQPAPEMRERAFAFRRERAAAMLQFAEEVAATRQEMAMGVIDRISEYLASMPAEAVAMLSQPTLRACDALLGTARTADQPTGVWVAAPHQLRRVNALKLQASTGGGNVDLRQLTCLVCFDEYPALKGLECNVAEGEAAGGSADPMPARHFVCEECLAGHVASAVEPGSIDLFSRRGGVRCVDPGCRAPAFTDAALAKALPEACFAQYTLAKERVAEQRINAELEAGFTERLRVEREKAGGEGRAAIKEYICEKILTLACPRCKQAFVDFNGCMALTCSRAGCGCGFCALCQADCGNDAHKHVGDGCPLAAHIGVRKGEFHLSDAAYTKAAGKAKALRLAAYLETLTEAQRQHALEDCAKELHDLGLSAADLPFGAANLLLDLAVPESVRVLDPRRGARRRQH